MQLRRILCPVDFSEATDAGLAPALSLATEFGAAIDLLHVLNFPYPQMDRVTPTFDLEAYYDKMQREALAHLDRLVDPESRRYTEVHPRVERGMPSQEILRVARDVGSDLIVMPTHGRRGLERMLFGSTAEKIVRLASCPVLTVSPKAPPAAFHPDRIVLATDFSAHAERALEAALDLAVRYDAELTMLHVVTLWESDPANPAWRFPTVPDEYRNSLVQVAEEQLEAQRTSCSDRGARVRTLLVRGFDPAAEIVRAAVDDVDADLVVLGTHGHTGLAHLLLGSVAEKVVRTFPRAVLTVRPDESATAAS